MSLVKWYPQHILIVLLEGLKLRKSLAYNSGVISSRLMKLFAFAVAHCIVHAKVGIPFLP